MYGNGTYFAVDPAYSAQEHAEPNAMGHKQMYLARVLVGDLTRGQQGLAALPTKDPACPSVLYDSVTHDEVNPSMSVIFNEVQVYPEFPITFTRAASDLIAVVTKLRRRGLTPPASTYDPALRKPFWLCDEEVVL